MNRSYPRALLWLALLLSLLASGYVSTLTPATQDQATGNTSSIHGDVASATGTGRHTEKKLKMRALASLEHDIFSDAPISPPQVDYLVPPLIVLPQQAQPEAATETTQVAAPPVVPPLPFTYLGRLGEAGSYKVFITAHGKNHAVSAGDLVIQHYRIERIDPPTMTVTYLPMNLTQTLPIGEPD